MKKIKVCHITSVHKRYDGRIFQKECCTLSENGYDVILLVNDEENKETCKDVKIFPVRCGKNRFYRILTASRKMYHVAKQVDASIYHIHDPELLPLGYKLSRKGKTVIFDSHEFYYYQIRQKTYIPKFFRILIAGMYKQYEKFVLSKISAVITPCTLNGKNYFKGKVKYVAVVNNCPKSEQFQMISYELKPDPVNCCYVGSLTKERGLIEMLLATEHTGTKFILAGEMGSKEKEQLKEHLYMPTLDYRGYVNSEQVQEIYNQAHIGLAILHNKNQYGLSDNLPTKVYEYMLSGIPIILSRRPYNEKFINKYQVGLCVDPNNIQEIENAIQYLKSHPKTAKNMGLRGRKIALERYCWEYEAEKMLDLYGNLMLNQCLE